MHFTSLIKVVEPKCKFIVEREGNVRNRFTSPWGYPMFYKPTCYPSCSGGHMVTLRCWKGCWPASVRDLRQVLWRRWRTWFPIGRLYKVQKGLYTVSLWVRLRCGRGKRERRDAFEHKVSLPKLAEHGCVRGRKQGRAGCCCRLGREYLLLCGERRSKKKKKDWLGHWRHCMWEYLWYVLSRPAGGVIGLHITCLEWWECSHCKLKCCSNLQAIISGVRLHTYCIFFYFFSSVWIKENYW